MAFTDTEYRLSHGKAPRGFGLWFFEVRKIDHQTGISKVVWKDSFSGTLSEAKKKAIKAAKAAGVDEYARIIICP